MYSSILGKEDKDISPLKKISQGVLTKKIINFFEKILNLNNLVRKLLGRH